MVIAFSTLTSFLLLPISLSLEKESKSACDDIYHNSEQSFLFVKNYVIPLYLTIHVFIQSYIQKVYCRYSQVSLYAKVLAKITFMYTPYFFFKENFDVSFKECSKSCCILFRYMKMFIDLLRLSHLFLNLIHPCHIFFHLYFFQM